MFTRLSLRNVAAAYSLCLLRGSRLATRRLQLSALERVENLSFLGS